MNALLNVNAEWAWSPYEPTAEAPWDVRRASHLLRRAGFSADREQVRAAVSQSPEEVVRRCLDTQEPAAFRQEISDLVLATVGSGDVKQLAAQWAYRMLRTPAPLLEKMTLFWHGHFATSAAKVDDIQLMQSQNELLRGHALGDFRELLLEISRDPAMLIYLDSVSNRKAHPNENYAREIMELFALGEGNYSETDIRELARCFTGWEIKRKKFRFNRYQHDSGTKSVLGKHGAWGGEEGVSIVASQASAPRFIASKLIRFLVMDEPMAPPALVEPLANQLREQDFNLRPTIQRILSSNLMFSDHAIGRIVRSPVEIGIGFLRALEGSTDVFQLARDLERLGQGLFYPPSVKGWDGGRTWINSSTLVGRANLIHRLIHQPKTRFGRKPLADYLRDAEVHSAADLVELFQETLFAVPVPGSARERIAAIYRDGSRNSEDRVKQAVHLLCTLPEFQLA